MEWFSYRIVNGQAMPRVSGKLVRGGNDSWPLTFLVDSGAAFSFVPLVSVQHLLKDLAGTPERDTGAADAQGGRLKGISVELDVVLTGAAKIPPTRERFWVSSQVNWPLLGQTWFEKHAIQFHNFEAAPSGRRFGMFPVKL